jgi:hypothetical protein
MNVARTAKNMHVDQTDPLVGADIATVGARLGPPLECRYLGPGDNLVPDGIVLSDGVVVREHSGLRSVPTLHGYFIGQPIERVLARFGKLVEVLHRPALLEMTFAAWRVCVHEGRVVLATPRTLTRAS